MKLPKEETPNRVPTIFQYDALNRITSLGYSSQAGSYSYLEDDAGKKTQVTEPSGRLAIWSYDGINSRAGWPRCLAFGHLGKCLDPVGNRTGVSSGISGLSPVAGSFNQDDELSAESYDQNGNVTATGGKTFAYNSQNQLISMGGTVSIVYDGDGNRVAKTVSGVATKYLVDDLNPTGYPQVLDELTNGAVSRTYAYGLQRIDEDQIISSAWTPSFYGYDGFGSVRQLTNVSGTVTDTYEYDAFGNKINSTGSTPNNYLYRGEQYDPDLGLYYLRARYYNPATGRFMSRDPEDPQLRGAKRIPIDPKKLHKYVYAAGDPVNAKDPTGKSLVGDLILMGETAAGVLAMELTDLSMDFQVIAACVEDLMMWGADEDSAWEKCFPPL